jgi:RNA polymerase sigma-70 factor (ECF subfamily)
MRIATNACLNELARRKRRGLPQLEREPAGSFDHIEQLEAADWLTPAPDDQLGALETRESVALAFLALLQRLPPRQRAVLLLKDVVGWSAEEIAEALETSESSVNSALHRARETVALRPEVTREEPPPDVLQAYIRSWETHDVAKLVTLLKDDIVFAMPPHATWFRGAALLGAFLGAPRFTTLWTRGFRLVPVRANGELALAFYARDGAGFRPHSLQVVRFTGNRLAEVVHFIGPDYLRGFGLPERLE